MSLNAWDADDDDDDDGDDDGDDDKETSTFSVSVLSSPRGNRMHELQDNFNNVVAKKSERGPAVQCLWTLSEAA